MDKSMRARMEWIARKARTGQFDEQDLRHALDEAYKDLPGMSDGKPKDPGGFESPEWLSAYAESRATMFSPIVGYDDVKRLFDRAIAAQDPVHVLLEGPPASAKTLFLMEVARLPTSHFALGGTSTKAGLTDALLTYRPTYLLIDEIETITNPKDYAALLHLMENHEIIETKFGRHHRIPIKTWIFAAGNDTRKLPPALLSRFGGPKAILHFRAYRVDEFLEIAKRVLVERENVQPEFAEKVARATVDLESRDVRLSVRLARLAKDEASLQEVVDTLRRYQ